MISKINDEFALELREVRATGSKLRESIDQHNFLPDDFPKEQINFLLVALHGLEDGSLEGARLPLEHANVRLSEIRRRYFVHRDQGLDGEDESPLPVLERGDSLDTRFSQLLSAISTALDAYREQSRSEYESLNTDEYIDILPGIAPANIGIGEGQQQINQFAELAGHARETRWAESVPIQDVALSAADAGNSLASVRAEASSQFVIRGWIKKLARFSADALNVLGKTLDAVSVAGQIAHEFYLRYKATVSKIREVVIKEAQEWLSFLASKIKDAESVVRRYADDHERKNYGIVEAIGRNPSVINHQRLPFAITSSERFVPRPGTMVEFDIDTSHFPPRAKNIKETGRFLIVDGQLLTPDQAREPILKKIESTVRARKAATIPMRQLERRYNTAKSGYELPARFWKILGYESLANFLTTSGRFFAYPSVEDAAYISLDAIQMEGVSTTAVKDWAYNELISEGGPIKIGEMALRASAKYSDGRLPVRLQVGINQFSSIFDGDARFQLSDGLIVLTDLANLSKL